MNKSINNNPSSMRILSSMLRGIKRYNCNTWTYLDFTSLTSPLRRFRNYCLLSGKMILMNFILLWWASASLSAMVAISIVKLCTISLRSSSSWSRLNTLNWSWRRYGWLPVWPLQEWSSVRGLLKMEGLRFWSSWWGNQRKKSSTMFCSPWATCRHSHLTIGTTFWRNKGWWLF